MGRKSIQSKILTFLKGFLIASVVLMTDYYIFKPSYRIIFLSLALLSFWYFFFNNPVLLSGNYGKKVRRDTKKVVIAAFVFIAYMLFNDFFVKNEGLEYLPDYISCGFIVLSLPILEDKRYPFPLVKTFYLLISISIFFGVLQFFGFSHNIGTLLPDLIFFQSDNFIDPATSSGRRISGAISSVVGFAEQISILLIILYYKFLNKKDNKTLIALFIAVAALLATQARAAIWGLIPTLYFTQIFVTRKKIKEIFKISIISVIVLFFLVISSNFITSRFTYLTKEIESSDTHRFETNYIMVKGVLMESPLFGISREGSWDIYDKYTNVGKINSVHATPTHHNQIGFYLRYYGLIGVGLLLWLYVTIFRKIKNCQSATVKMALLSIFLFDFIYSLAHNNKLIVNPILWIFLSLASFDFTKERKPF